MQQLTPSTEKPNPSRIGNLHKLRKRYGTITEMVSSRNWYSKSHHQEKKTIEPAKTGAPQFYKTLRVLCIYGSFGTIILPG